MADNHGAISADHGMDMAAHEETYVGFIAMTQLVAAHVLTIVLLLVLWGLEGHGFVALLGFVVLLVATVIGAITGSGWKAIAPVFVLIGLACIVL